MGRAILSCFLAIAVGVLAAQLYVSFTNPQPKLEGVGKAQSIGINVSSDGFTTVDVEIDEQQFVEVASIVGEDLHDGSITFGIVVDYGQVKPLLTDEQLDRLHDTTGFKKRQSAYYVTTSHRALIIGGHEEITA